jgi:hypothetical protein
MMLSSTTSSRLASSIRRYALLSSSSRRWLASPSSSIGAAASLSTTTANADANEAYYIKTRLALSAMAMGGSILAASTAAGGDDDDDASRVVAKCMTINAVVGKNNFDARNYLLDGLDKIKSRGYDGAGIATMAATRGDMVSVYTQTSLS